MILGTICPSSSPIYKYSANRRKNVKISSPKREKYIYICVKENKKRRSERNDSLGKLERGKGNVVLSSPPRSSPLSLCEDSSESRKIALGDKRTGGFSWDG